MKDIEKKDKDAERDKQLRADKHLDNREIERIHREARQEQEWEDRAQAIDRQEATIHHLKVEEEKKKKERRLFQDKMIDNRCGVSVLSSLGDSRQGRCRAVLCEWEE